MTEDDIKAELKKDLDIRSELLQKVRDFHFEKQYNALRDYAGFVTKIGEISFVVGAAITPIVLVSQDKIQHLKFIYIGIFLYLLNGIIALWKSKDMVENQLDAFAPGNLHQVEKKVYPLQFLANKIILEYKEDDRKEYVKKIKEFVINNSEEKISKSINVFLDILVFLFVSATLLVSRSIWPFSDNAYWHFFGGVLLIVIGLIIIGAVRTKSLADANAQNTKELNEIKSDYADYFSKKIEGQNENQYPTT